ncbi:MAG: hypothetical protein ACFHX7_07440 [Pseudomonadota bacterium]
MPGYCSAPGPELARVLLVLLVPVLLAGCETLPVQSPAMIATREPILLQAPVRFGHIVAGSDNLVTWENIGELVLTPGTLYFTRPGQSYSISYLSISDAFIGPVNEWHFWPLGSPTRLPDLLRIEADNSTCQHGCAFSLPSLAISREAKQIIERYRPGLDPFGRFDTPGRVELVSGCRQPNVFWSFSPHYLLRHYPTEKQALETRVRAQAKHMRQTFEQALSELLVGTAGDFDIHRFPESGTDAFCDAIATGRAGRLVREQTGSNRLLIAEIGTITLEESITAQYEASVLLHINLMVHYLDLDPIKSGLRRGNTLAVRIPLSASSEPGPADFSQQVYAAAARVRDLVLEDLQAAAIAQ